MLICCDTTFRRTTMTLVSLRSGAAGATSPETGNKLVDRDRAVDDVHLAAEAADLGVHEALATGEPTSGTFDLDEDGANRRGDNDPIRHSPRAGETNFRQRNPLSRHRRSR